MTQLALSSTRYGEGRKHSPGALAAAIAINGGVFALLIALPASDYIKEKVDILRVIEIAAPQDPPPVRPDPVVEKKPLLKPVEQPREPELPYVHPPIVPTGGDAVITGTTDFTIKTGTGDEYVAPLDPPRKPLFRGATRDPRYADAFHPDYPPGLRRLGLEGSVTVRVTIDEKGRVIAVEQVSATDPAFFRETRDQALRHWRFRPATSDGVPVQSQQTLTVHFELEE